MSKRRISGGLILYPHTDPAVYSSFKGLPPEIVARAQEMARRSGWAAIEVQGYGDHAVFGVEWGGGDDGQQLWGSKGGWQPVPEPDAEGDGLAEVGAATEPAAVP
jgi:hypothetical protein